MERKLIWAFGASLVGWAGGLGLGWALVIGASVFVLIRSRRSTETAIVPMLLNREHVTINSTIEERIRADFELAKAENIASLVDIYGERARGYLSAKMGPLALTTLYIWHANRARMQPMPEPSRLRSYFSSKA